MIATALCEIGRLMVANLLIRPRDVTYSRLRMTSISLGSRSCGQAHEAACVSRVPCGSDQTRSALV